MLDSDGQASRGGMVKTIFVGVILAVVLGMATSMVVANLPASSDYSTTVSGTGGDNLDVRSYVSVDNGSLTTVYDMSSSDNLTVTLNSKTIVDKTSVTGTGTVENDVASEIVEGNNEVIVSTDGGNESSLTTTLDVTVKDDTLGVVDMAKSMGPTIVTFVFLGLLVLAIVGLIRYFRAI